MSEVLQALRQAKGEAPEEQDDSVIGILRQATGTRDRSGDAARQAEMVEQERVRLRQEMNDDMSPVERFAVGFDRGISRLGQGLIGQGEDPATKAAADDLRDRYPSAVAGDIVGTTMALGPLAAIPGGATIRGVTLLKPAQSLLARLGLATGTGAAEGALIAQAEGQTASQTATSAGVAGVVAGAADLLMPVVGRMAGKVWRAVTNTAPRGALVTPDGQPTESLLNALRDANMSWDDLTDEAVDFVYSQNPNASAQELARAARFRSQGIRATTGDITQDFGQQAREARLAQSVDRRGGDPLRAAQAQKSDDFIAAVEGQARQFGDPQNVGASVQGALTGRRESLQATKNQLYRQAAEQADRLGGFPLYGDEIANALPDVATLRRLSRLEGSQINALQDLLVEFGIDNRDEVVEAFLDSGGSVTPLSLQNVEDFRSALNLIKRADRSGAATVAVQPVIDALDNEVDTIAKVLKDVGDPEAQELLDTLKAARSTTRTLKTEFSPQSIAGRLVDVKRDGVTPVVEASRVFDELKNKPVEQLQRTLSSLARAGQTGRQAIGDIKAAVVMEALEEALKAPSNKYGGAQMANTGQFAKFLDQRFGMDKLQTLFKQDDDGLRRLMALAQTAKDIMPAAGAVPKGSAAVNDEMFRRLERIVGPMAGAVMAPLRAIIGPSSDALTSSSALAARIPQRELTALQSAYPTLLATLGIAATTKRDDEDAQTQ